MEEKTKIRTVLLKVGVPPHLSGYRFLKTGLQLAIDNPDILEAMTREFYPAVALAWGSSSSRVERALRHAIDCSMRTISEETANDLFGNSIEHGEVPTNSHFIAALVEYMECM